MSAGEPRTLEIEMEPFEVFKAYNPLMDEVYVAAARSNIEKPVVIWCKATNHPGWNRLSNIIELAEARRFQKNRSKHDSLIAITPATISATEV